MSKIIQSHDGSRVLTDKANPAAYTTIYAVKKCPQFLEETAEIKAKLRGYRMAKHEQPAAAEGFYKLIN